METVIRQKIF